VCGEERLQACMASAMNTPGHLCFHCDALAGCRCLRLCILQLLYG
jgi:hypothetical protein